MTILCSARFLSYAFVLVAGLASIGHAADNQLGEDEKKDGWKLLFDGTTTTGWANRGSDKLKNWEAVDGVLRRVSKFSDAVYVAEQFENYHLSLDWKIADKGNSGVFVRLSSQQDWINTGSEIQILDINETREMSHPTHVAGSLYDLVAPAAGCPPMKHLEWNHFDIICDGPKMSAVMNGVQTFAIDVSEPKWQTNQGKFKKPLGTLPRKGWIMLQDHGADVDFKNIKIKLLDPH